MSSATSVPVPGFLSLTIAIVVFFLGSGINSRVATLRNWNIPDAVTGGLLAALATFAAYRVFNVAISFDLGARDLLLLYFFTGIGLNARLDDVIAGGRPLLKLLLLTIAFLVIQNLIARGAAGVLGLPPGISILLGSVSLIGGHGTTVAWAPAISERFGMTNAMEIGIASATLGLIAGSLVGGPVAGLLIRRFKLSGPKEAALAVGLPRSKDDPVEDDLNHLTLMQTLLVLNVAILIGYAFDEFWVEIGIKLPLFVSCLLVAIVLTNVVPRLAPKLRWPTRSRSLALISDLSLSIFLAMSLMSMQLWALGSLGPALVIVLLIQTVAAALYILFVVFVVMGRNYDAAVIASGFAGISLGATPTAIANMTAVTKLHGAAPMAFIILPLVSAFFIDIANTAVISFFIR